MFYFTRLTLICGLPPRPRVDACIHMSGKLLPEWGHLECLCNVVDKDVFDLLASNTNVRSLILYFTHAWG